MRQISVLFGLIAFGLGVAEIASAQPANRPHLDLVRGLRKENMPDLALQYLDELKKSNPPPEIAMLLPLEYARTWLDLSAEENDENTRNGLIGQARREIEAFLTAHPAHEMALQANRDLARLYAVQGKTQLRKARRIDDEKERMQAIKAVRPILVEAAKRYQDTAKLTEAQIKKFENDKSPAGQKHRRYLVDSQLEAELDRGITAFYIGTTFPTVGAETKDIQDRGAQFGEAAKIFDKIMNQDPKMPICWVARAWFAQSKIKAGDHGAADRELEYLMGKKNDPAASAGIRVARYFTILNNFEDSGENVASFTKLEKDASDWLRDYRAYRDTSEGLALRYYLGVAKRDQIRMTKDAIKVDKDGRITAITTFGRQRFEEAERIFKELTETENEFSERANRNRSQILVTLADAEGQGKDPTPESLLNFERCYLMAQVQVARLSQFKHPAERSPPPAEKIHEEEVRRFTNAVHYLERGVSLVNPSKDNPRDVFAAKLFLVACYSQLKFDPQAAILAEYLARTNPKLPKAPVAGSIAVEAYNRSQIDLREIKKNAPALSTDPATNEKMWDDKFKADMNRLINAAAFVIKQWPMETATDQARHILGFFALRDKKYEDAWKELSEIHNGYSDLQTARLQLASCMFTMVYPADAKDAAQIKRMIKDRLKQYDKEWKKTISVLESVPTPGDSAPAYEVTPYIDNRVQLATLYQLEDANEKAQKVGELLLKSLNNFTSLPALQKANQAMKAQSLVLGAIRMQAYKELIDGNHARVAELLDPRIVEIQKDIKNGAPAEEPPMFQRLRKAQREVLMLALQSAAQDGKTDRASELLDILNKSGGSAEESLSMMSSLVNSVRTQIKTLEAAMKAAEAKSLKDGFAKLLEKMAAEGDKLPTRTKLFLAEGLSSVDAFGKATEILEAVRKSPGGDTAEEQQKYQHQAQYYLARNYRNAKEYDKALKVFDDMIGKVTIKEPRPKTPGWAFASMQIRKEKAMTMEEMAANASKEDRFKYWAAAGGEWDAIRLTFAPSLQPLYKRLSPADEAKQTPEERDHARTTAEENARKRGTYFDLFFERKRCTVMAYKHLGVDATKGSQQALDDAFAKLAKDLLALQSKEKNPDLSATIKDQIKELVASVEELRREYVKLQSAGGGN